MRSAALRTAFPLVVAIWAAGACDEPDRTPTPTLTSSSTSTSTPIPNPTTTPLATASPTPSPSLVADAWVMHTSKTFPYRMAHPPGWTVEPSNTEDAYAIDGQPYVYVAAQAVDAGTTLDAFSNSLQSFYKDDFGKPVSEVDVTLGGQPARRLVYEFVNGQGQDVTFVDDVTVRGERGWEVFLVTAGGVSDIPVFDQFVATFAFTD